MALRVRAYSGLGSSEWERACGQAPSPGTALHPFCLQAPTLYILCWLVLGPPPTLPTPSHGWGAGAVHSRLPLLGSVSMVGVWGGVLSPSSAGSWGRCPGVCTWDWAQAVSIPTVVHFSGANQDNHEPCLQSPVSVHAGPPLPSIHSGAGWCPRAR